MDPICYESTRTATTRKATWVLACAPRVPPCICDMLRYPPCGPPLVYTLLVLSTGDGTKDVSFDPLVGGWTGRRVDFPVVVTSPSFLPPFLSGPTYGSGHGVRQTGLRRRVVSSMIRGWLSASGWDGTRFELTRWWAPFLRQQIVIFVIFQSNARSIFFLAYNGFDDGVRTAAQMGAM
jgi:hypothetical protein